MFAKFWKRNNGMANYALKMVHGRLDKDFQKKLDVLHGSALRTGLVNKQDLQEAYCKIRVLKQVHNLENLPYVLSVLIFIFLATPFFYALLTFLMGVRCFLPNNYLVLEATRPISDCDFCHGISGPIILTNLSREQFTAHAYSSQPIVIKQAVTHWPATKVLNFSYLKALYERTPGALDKSCQFLHFNSNIKTLRELFEKSAYDQQNNKKPTWYVGLSNCHPAVLQQLRQLYPRPHFLPADAEMPHTDYIFLGYEQVAFMHLNYMPRLLWQAQLQGNKSCIISPMPECDHVCKSFSFNVESGDAVLMDPRIWYHGTAVPKNQFAITIQSEYG